MILLTTLLPSSSLPTVSVWWDLFSIDSFAHVFLFCVLTFLMIVGFAKQFTLLKLKHYPIRYALFISTLFGIFVELMQHFFIPGRHGDIVDVLCNTLGCLIGIVLFKWVYVW
ncbi:VanZ family protein [Pontibacter diazotrophicus]|uniref:VanZ family protein n=1 Tax=Pontibacter diazotrophicus TaxID=1400979 RepID=UPI001FE92431|nr:VanZ family protein [Pontibacter diazotrophicus]